MTRRREPDRARSELDPRPVHARPGREGGQPVACLMDRSRMAVGCFDRTRRPEEETQCSTATTQRGTRLRIYCEQAQARLVTGSMMREHPLARNVHFRLEDRAAARLGDEQRFVIRTAESHVRGVRLGAAANAIDRLSERVEHPHRAKADMRYEQPAIRV